MSVDQLIEQHIWCFTHSIAVTYLPTQAEAFKTYMASLATLYPLPSYGHQLRCAMDCIPVDPYLGNNYDLFFWTYAIRDYINQQHNIKSAPYDEIKHLYFGRIEQNCKTCQLSKENLSTERDDSEKRTGNEFWGPCGWFTIHLIGAAYQPSPETKKSATAFMNALTHLLPCEKCKVNLQHKLNAVPIQTYLASRRDLFFWTYVVHDMANQHLDKTSPSLEQAQRMYGDLVRSAH